MKNKRTQWIAIACAMAVCFSVVVTHSVQGAQLKPSAGSGIEQSVSNLETKSLLGIGWGSIATVVATVGAILLAYNLATARKQGWGWIVLSAVAVTFIFIGRLAASLFCEISSDSTGISDWDSD